MEQGTTSMPEVCQVPLAGPAIRAVEEGTLLVFYPLA